MPGENETPSFRLGMWGRGGYMETVLEGLRLSCGLCTAMGEKGSYPVQGENLSSSLECSPLQLSFWLFNL